MRFGNYEITTDAMNWKLEEVGTVKGKESKNYGKETFTLVGFYGSLEGLIVRLEDFVLRDVWSMSENTIEATEMLIMELENISKIKEELK